MVISSRADRGNDEIDSSLIPRVPVLQQYKRKKTITTTTMDLHVQATAAHVYINIAVFEDIGKQFTMVCRDHS